MFGLPLAEHDARYDYLDEWVSVLEDSGRRREEFEFEGKFLKLKGAMSIATTDPTAAPGHHERGVSSRGQRLRRANTLIFALSLRASEKRVSKATRRWRVSNSAAKLGVWAQVPIVQREPSGGGSFSMNYFGGRARGSPIGVDGWSAG